MELREYIRLLLTPDAQLDKSMVDDIGLLPAQAAVTGAFVAAVERRFPNDPSHADIAALVSRIRESYVEEDRLPPMLGEALVRIALGEDSLAEGMSYEEVARGQQLMTYGMVHDLGLRGASFEEFLTEAVQAAEEIVANETSRS